MSFLCLSSRPRILKSTMLKIARKKEGVKTILSTAEEFLDQEKVYSKILILGCYHHFDDPGLVFTKIAGALSDNGVCLVMGMTFDSAPMFFKSTFQRFGFSSNCRIG